MASFTKKLSRVTLYELALFGEACFFLAISSFLRIVVPFKLYAPLFGVPNKADLEQPDIVSDERAIAIGLAVRRGSRYLPLDCMCLVQAMASTAMLRSRGIKSVVYLGVSKDEDQGLVAHAWVKNGSNFVVGERGFERHKVISVFTN